MRIVNIRLCNEWSALADIKSNFS